MKNLILLFLLFFSGQILAQTSLNGKITDEETGEAMPFAKIEIYNGSDLIIKAVSDINGLYNFSNIDSGTYDIEVSFSGYSSLRIGDVTIYMGEATKMDFQIYTSHSFDCGTVVKYKIPLIKFDQTTSGATFSSNQLKRFYHGSQFTNN